MATLSRQPQNQQVTINRRLPLLIAFLVMAGALLLLALASFQWLSPEVAREFLQRAQANTTSSRRIPAERGLIYDRDGEPLAFNNIQYEIGVSPNLVTDPVTVSRELALTLDLDEFEVYRRVTQLGRPWVQIARPVSAEVGQEIEDNENLALSVTINPLSNRFYPQGSLASQVLGFVIEENAVGAMGLEAYYNDELVGRVIDERVSTVPFSVPDTQEEDRQRGMSLVLTIDRDVQFWVETALEQFVQRYDAEGGTIIVMEPRTGDILAMFSYPTFDPNDFINVDDPDLLSNPAISNAYEPGSVFKVLTVAAAIESGVVTPEWTYNDTGVLEEASIRVLNSDQQAYGVRNGTDVLVQSLNIGVATMALQMGPDVFYAQMRRFGIGEPTRIDLEGENSGILLEPGDPNWSESNLLTNSFGQGVSVTPLQMLTAVSAIANDGLMMQPRLVRQIIDGEEVTDLQPVVLRNAISPATARQVRDMMVRVVNDPDGAPRAGIPGYSIAGKTGTAQIPIPTGYAVGRDSTITSFVGFLPADDPRVAVLIRLDRPDGFPDGYWGSQTTAPAFRDLAARLAILLGIPDDTLRRTLTAQGGQVSSP